MKVTKVNSKKAMVLLYDSEAERKEMIDNLVNYIKYGKSNFDQPPAVYRLLLGLAEFDLPFCDIPLEDVPVIISWVMTSTFPAPCKIHNLATLLYCTKHPAFTDGSSAVFKGLMAGQPEISLNIK